MGSRYVNKHLHVDKTVAHFSYFNLYCATGGKQIHPSVRPLFCHTDPGGPPQPISAVTPESPLLHGHHQEQCGKKRRENWGNICYGPRPYDPFLLHIWKTLAFDNPGLGASAPMLKCIITALIILLRGVVKWQSGWHRAQTDAWESPGGNRTIGTSCVCTTGLFMYSKFWFSRKRSDAVVETEEKVLGCCYSCTNRFK